LGGGGGRSLGGGGRSSEWRLELRIWSALHLIGKERNEREWWVEFD
jgi:hypothetical protein